MMGSGDSDEKSAAMTHGEDTEQPQREARAWLARLQPGHATTADLEEFRRWSARSPAHAQAFAETRQLWTALAPAARKVAARGTTAIAAQRASASRRTVNRRAILGGALAAGAAAAGGATVGPALGLWPSLPDLMAADYRTSTGERRRLSLAENASFEMNTQTSIAVEDERRIKLISGEGAIVSGSQFLDVIAGNGRARARNSSFCIRRVDSVVRVTCLDGEVQISCGDHATSIGTDQQLSYSDAGLGPIISVNPETVTAWRTGKLIFHDTPFIDVVAEANRYRRGKIIVANAALGRRLVNARFSLDQIDDLVPKLTNAFGATATWLPAGVVILS